MNPGSKQGCSKDSKAGNSNKGKPRKAGEMAKMKIKEAAMSGGKY